MSSVASSFADRLLTPFILTRGMLPHPLPFRLSVLAMEGVLLIPPVGVLPIEGVLPMEGVVALEGLPEDDLLREACRLQEAVEGVRLERADEPRLEARSCGRRAAAAASMEGTECRRWFAAHGIAAGTSSHLRFRWLESTTSGVP